MKKKLKTTEISFNEADPMTTIYTYNTKLKKRLLEFSEECPDLCKVIFKDEDGCIGFEINKDDFTFRCMKPASDEKREKAREQMNKLIGKSTESSATISETETQPKKTLWEQKYGKKQQGGCYRFSSRRKGVRHNAPTRFTSDGSADRINEISGAFESFREMKVRLKVYVGNAMIFTLAPHKTL